MNFNRHSEIEGKHAFLSASKYHWIRYDPEKMTEIYHSFYTAEQGTRLHEFAAHCIRMGEKLQKKKRTLNMFVNDSIDYGMTSEQPLYYSRNCFGTTDAIAFSNGILRINDFKSGTTPAHMEQLYVYAALFCLEYDVNPEDIKTILSIYQNNEIVREEASPETIRDVMNKAIQFDALIEDIRMKEAFS